MAIAPDRILYIRSQSRVTTHEAIEYLEWEISDRKSRMGKGIEEGNERKIIRNRDSMNMYVKALENVKNAPYSDVVIMSTITDPECIATGKIGTTY